MNKENSIDIPTPSTHPIQSMIENYKKHIAETQLKDEVYKWELLEEYKGKPDLEAKNLHEEIKSINYSNLMYHLSKAVINELTEANPDEIRRLFAELFDESVDLTERVKAFSKQTNRLYRALGKTNQHHQDERAISAYLTYRYPEKYTFYKHTFYKNYCKLLGIKQAKKNEKYTHYLSLLDELIERYVTSDKELTEQVKSYIPKYDDGGNQKLLAQDILYQMMEKNAGINYWVFQGNPDKYDFETAFRKDDIHAWTVTSHKTTIKKGDKVIIWITGSKAGCYALADVVSEPLDRASFPKSYLWKVDDTSELKVAINITHNLANSPILKDEIDDIEELANLKVGNQGTNFAATEKEYKAILSRVEQGVGFEEVRGKFEAAYGAALFDNFIDNLRKIVSEFHLQPSDKRIVYSVRHNRLNFLIGQRYCFNIDMNHEDGVHGFIFTEQMGHDSYRFKGKPKAYFNNTADFALVAERWDGMMDCMRRELERSEQSSYLKNNNEEFENYVFDIENMPSTISKKMTTPTNTILYGPPGTGKTYNTVNEALRIVDNEFLHEHIDDRAALNERFRGLRYNPETGEGQIAFITFHQSLSYEDFIEGIKPKKNDGDEAISYEVCDGLFKSIAIKASDKKVVVWFDDIYDQFKNHVMQQDSFSLQTPYQKKPFDVRINGNGNCVAIPQTETATEMVVTKKMIADFLLDGTVRDWKPYLSSIAEYIKTNYNYKVDREDNTNKPYVIIIDEINRGNISQIFGELITLIEPDKRKGQPEEIEAILPYSKERFGVPSNLHIIGTMNTADRSVEALDTALRRRFSFVEMHPAPWLLAAEGFKCEGINLEAMLVAINERIEKLLDRDYCIGHAYFMTIKEKQEPLQELKSVFRNKLLPLLQEYFYGDWGKIRLIVGKGFVDMKKGNGVQFLDVDSVDDYEEFDEKPIYNFTNPEGWTLDTFRQIYE